MLGVCLSLLNENTSEGRKGCSFAHATVCFVFWFIHSPPEAQPLGVRAVCMPCSIGLMSLSTGRILAQDTLGGWLAQKGWFSSENSDKWVWCRAALSVCPLPSYRCCYKEDSAAYVAVAVLSIAHTTEIRRCCVESAPYARLRAAEVQQLLGEQAGPRTTKRTGRWDENHTSSLDLPHATLSGRALKTPFLVFPCMI